MVGKYDKENPDWKGDYNNISQESRLEKSQDRNWKDKLLPNTPMDNIPKLNELIYAGAKLVSDKNRCSSKEPELNTKPASEIRLEEQVKKLRQAKKTKEGKNTRIC